MVSAKATDVGWGAQAIGSGIGGWAGNDCSGVPDATQPHSVARAMQARSASAAIVSSGLMPSEVGTIAPSITTRLSNTTLPPPAMNTCPRWLTTPWEPLSAMRQPPSGCTVSSRSAPSGSAVVSAALSRERIASSTAAGAGCHIGLGT